MLQQRPVLSQIQNIKGLEPELSVRETLPRNNAKSSNSTQSEYDFEKAMAATRQQMDRHLEAKREVRQQNAMRQERALQAQRNQEARAEQNKTQQERAQENNRRDARSEAAHSGPRADNSNVRSSENRRDLDNQSQQTERHLERTEHAQSDRPKKSDTISNPADSTSKLEPRGQADEAGSDRRVEGKPATTLEPVDSTTPSETITDNETPVTKALTELEALLESILSGDSKSDAKSKTEQLLQSLAALMKGEATGSDADSLNVNIDEKLAQLLDSIASLTGNPDGPSIDPLSQLVHNIDLGSVLEQLGTQLNNLSSLDLSQMTEQQRALFEQLQEQLKLLTQKLTSFSEQSTVVTPDSGIESSDSEETTLNWLNDVVLKLKNTVNKDVQTVIPSVEGAASIDLVKPGTATEGTPTQLIKNGSAMVSADSNKVAVSSINSDSADQQTKVNLVGSVTNNGANVTAKSDGNAPLAQQLAAAASTAANTETVQTKPQITTPIQLQGEPNGQNNSLAANTVSPGAVTAELDQKVGQSDKLNDFKLSELQRLMTDTGTSKSSQLKSLIESGVLSESVNTDKPTTYAKPSVVEVAGVQLDKTLQAPKLENMSQTKTDAVIKENILFNKQALASNIQAQVGMMLARNMKSVDIRLDPPELGSMQVKLSLGEQANVSFVVSSQQAKDALEESLPRLKELLEQQGMQLGDSDVRKDNGNSNSDEQESENDSLNTAGTNESSDKESDDEQAIKVKVKSPWQVDDYA